MKKRTLTALAVIMAAGIASAAELYKDSFEGGLGNWYLLNSNDVSAASVSTPAGAVTDGAKAVEFTHTDTSGIVEFARLGHDADAAFFAALKDPNAATMSIDFFVPGSVTVGTSWSQASLRLQCNGVDEVVDGFPTKGVDSLVTVEIDLSQWDLTSINWAQVTLNYNGSTETSRSPIYVDNFRITSDAAAAPGFYTDSFEGSAVGWTNNNIEPTTVIGFTNAPAEAVTDGSQAMVLAHDNIAPGFVSVVRLQHDLNAEWFAALKNTNTAVMSVDVHIPDTSLANFWANFSMTYQGGFGVDRATESVDATYALDLGTNNTFTAEIVFSPEDIAGISTSYWGQLTISMNGGSEGTLSPIYLDNFRVWDGAAPLVGYEAWAAGFPAMGAEDGPNDNPDGDRLNNLYEYGLGGSPVDPLDQGIAPVYEVVEDGGANWLMYTYPVRSDSESGLEYYLETTANLTTGGWVDGGYETVGSGVPGGDFNYSTNRVPTTGDSTFVRLIIEQLIP